MRRQSEAGGAATTLEDAKLIDQGFSADVYARGEGRVLKLFLDRVPRDRVHGEFAVSKAIHEAGLLVPAAYELIAPFTAA